MEQFPGTLRHHTQPGRQQDRPEVDVTTDDPLPDEQSVSRVEPTGGRAACCPVQVELAAQQLQPRDYVRRLPDPQVAGLARCVVAGTKKMGEAACRRDIRRAGVKLVEYNDTFTVMVQVVTA
jgi:hypothetical protein